MKRVDFASRQKHDVAIFARQSPLNRLRWEIEFACGASIWVTSKRRPGLLRRKCPCEAK